MQKPVAEIPAKSVCSRRGHWLWGVLLALLLLSPAAAKLVQPFNEEGANHFDGVYLRAQRHGHLVATADGVKFYPGATLTKPPRRISEVQRLASVLEQIEASIRDSDYRGVELRLAELEKALAAFNQLARSSLVVLPVDGEGAKSVRVAQQYFAEQARVAAPSARLLRLAEDVRQLDLDAQRGIVEVGPPLFDRVLALYRRQAALGDASPLVEEQANVIGVLLDRNFRRAYQSMSEEALTNLRRHGMQDEALELLTKLREGEAIDRLRRQHDPRAQAIYARAQAEFVEQLFGILDAARQEFEAKVDQMISFEDGEVAIDQRPFLRRRNALQDVNYFLRQIEDRAFGATREQVAERIGEVVSANDRAIEIGDGRREAFLALKVEFGEAEAALRALHYQQARERYQRVAERLEQLELRLPRMLAYISQQETSAEALALQDQLRNPQDLDTEQLAKLADEASAFIINHQAEMAQVGVDLDVFQEDLLRTQKYRSFLIAYQKVRNAVADGEALKAWDYAVRLSRWLERERRIIHPVAQSAWHDYMEQNRDALVSAATREFRASQPDLHQPRQQNLLKSFVGHYLEKGRLEQARETIEFGLTLLEGSGRIPITQELVGIYLEVAEAHADQGDYAQVQDIFARIQSDPDMQLTGVEVQSRMGRLIVAQARSMAAKGDNEGALSMYERVCDEFGAYAKGEQIYDEMLQLRLKMADFDDDLLDSGEALVIVDDFCEKYPNQFAYSPTVLDFRREMIESFERDWREHPRNAVVTVRKFCEEYPHLARQADLMNRVLTDVLRDLREYQREDTPSVPAYVFEVLNVLLPRDPDPELKQYTAARGVPRMYVELRLRQAEAFVRTNQVTKASAVYQGILDRYSVYAEEYEVAKTMEDLEFRLQVESFTTPLGIRAWYDWLAFAVTPFIWLIYLAAALWRSRKRGVFREVALHWVCRVAVFIFLMFLFLSSAIGHGEAVVAALVIPAVIFNGIGMGSYFFFPTIYAQRRLELARYLGGQLDNLGMSDAASVFRADEQRLSRELPLLADRRQLDLERARTVAETDPAKGRNRYEKVLQELRDEPEKKRDETWQETYSRCLYRLGLLLYETGELERCEALLAEHLALPEPLPEVRELYGFVLFEQGRYEDCIPELKQALSGRQDSDELWYRLGRANYETGSLTAACKCFETVNRKNRDVLFYGARAYAQNREHDRALRWYDALFEAVPDDDEGAYYVASFLASYAQDVRALEFVDLIGEDSPFFAQAEVLRGNLHFRGGRFDQAHAHFDRAARLRPDLASARIGLGQLALRQGDSAEALRIFEEIHQVYPELPAANYFRGVLAETKDPEFAIACFDRSAESPEFCRHAHFRVGRLNFFAGQTAAALQRFTKAEAEGEQSPWFMYFYLYTLLVEGQVEECRQRLVKVLVRTATDPDWLDAAPSALYELGCLLFEREQYEMAFQCFEHVRQHAAGDSKQLSSQIEETRFRLVMELLGRGEFGEAQSLVAMLQLETTDPQRFDVCQYYLALCQLFLGEYDSAHQMFEALAESKPGNARYRYHMTVAGLLNEPTAPIDDEIDALSKAEGLPKHLFYGLRSLRAYSRAARGKWAEAERELVFFEMMEPDFAGADEVRRKAILARVYYLCQMGATDTLDELLNSKLHEEDRAVFSHLAAYFKFQQNDVEEAIKILRPYVGRSAKNRQLFSLLVTARCRELVAAGEHDDACELLRGIDEPEGDLATVQYALRMYEVLGSIETVEDLAGACDALREILGVVQDKRVSHMVAHNLAILRLRYAVAAEEHVASHVERSQIWEETLDFWQRYVMRNLEYWNLEQDRLAGPNEVVRPFTASELEALSQRLAREALFDVFEAYIFAYLQAGDVEAINRFLELYRRLGENLGKAKPYIARFSEKVDTFLEKTTRNAPQWDTWDFAICALALQISINRILDLPSDPLERDLARWQEYSQIYEKPSDYTADRKRWTTALLHALQQGIQGNFSVAGNELQKVFDEIPPGMSLGALEDGLRRLQRYCRGPLDEGVNLSHEFEKMYHRSRNHKFQED